MENLNMWKTVRIYLSIFLKISGSLIGLSVTYILAIIVTNGDFEGKIAAAIGILLASCVLYFFWKKQWLIFSGRYVLSIVLLLWIGFIVYTVIPVANTHKVEKVADFQNVRTRYWNLHTGSKIAYYKLNADIGMPKKTIPIIFIHGGPGAYVKQSDVNFFSMFTKQGYDVYLYDQAGSGRSPLLDKTLYSHQRNVADFYAITEKIRAKRYIVIGHSYGASLLASISAHSLAAKKIAKAIYAEPGILIEPTTDLRMPRAANAGLDDVNIPLRLFMGIIINPKGNFISQNEVINYFFEHPRLLYKLSRSAFPIADSARITHQPTGAINFVVNSIVASEVNKYNENLPEKFKLQRIPSMLIIGESSYIERNGPVDLLRINPNITRVQYLTGVGHALWNGLDNHNLIVKRSIDEFLNDQPSTIPNYPQIKDIDDFVQKRR